MMQPELGVLLEPQSLLKKKTKPQLKTKNQQPQEEAQPHHSEARRSRCVTTEKQHPMPVATGIDYR